MMDGFGDQPFTKPSIGNPNLILPGGEWLAEAAYGRRVAFLEKAEAG
jgi:hypothetical protein